MHRALSSTAATTTLQKSLVSPCLVQADQRRCKTIWRRRPLFNPPLDIRDKLQVTKHKDSYWSQEEHGRHDAAWKAKELNIDWKRHQRHLKKVTLNVVPDRFKEYDQEFDKVVSFEKQLASLEKRGFLRPYRAYEPPKDLDQRFMRVCSEVLDNFPKHVVQDLDQIRLDDLHQKQKLLNALEKEFNHSVPNSLLHTLTSLDRLLHFYSARVDVRTPYEKLHKEANRGALPPNLHVQLDPLRFNPESGDEFSVTAYPGHATIMVTPEARKKYKDYIPEERHPWINSYGDLPKAWGPNSKL